MKHFVLLLMVAYAVKGAESEVARFKVGGIDFCVPRVLIIEEMPGWIPDRLPNDGFAFRIPTDRLRGLIPQRNRLGNPQEFSAFISSAKPPDADSLRSSLAKRGREAGAILEAVPKSDLLFLYEAANRNHWIAWKLPPGAPRTVAEIEARGVPVALCSRPHGSIQDPSWKGTIATCSRQFQFQELRVGYSMDAQNLERSDSIDGQLRDVVSGWKCAI